MRFYWMLIIFTLWEKWYIFPLYVTCISQVSMKLAQKWSQIIGYNLYFTWFLSTFTSEGLPGTRVWVKLVFMQYGLKAVPHTTGLAKPTLFWGSLFYKDEEIWTVWVSELPKGMHS